MNARYMVRYAALCIICGALAACATPQTIVQTCVTPEQYEELKRQEPPKVKDELSGRADQDIRVISGSAIRLRAWGRGLLGVVEGCSG